MRTSPCASVSVEATFDDRVVLLSPLHFSYHDLDPIGARIWMLLDTPQSVNERVIQLVDTFAVDEETCRADVDLLISRMTEIGLVASSG